MTRIPIQAYDQHIAEALKLLEELGDEGLDQLRTAMSVLMYRLSKILTIDPAPNQSIDVLLIQDLQAHVTNRPESAEFSPKLPQARKILDQVLTLASLYMVDRVLKRVQPDLSDDIAKHQNPSLRDVNKPYSSWGRPLPFRPMFCLFSVFATVFPVLGTAKRYDDVPSEDDPQYAGGADKPKTRQDKQRTFATLLDGLDYKIGYWKSHAKSEVAYTGKTPYMGNPAQRPGRIGKCYWRKPKGSISPDIVIVKLRNAAPTPDNVTHCVDMKFGDDEMSVKQQDNYLDLFPDRLYVLYFPRDCTYGDEPESQRESMPDWAKVLMALLLLLLSKGKIRLPPRGPTPVPAPA